MSNTNFDRLDKQCELANARDMLKHAETSRARTDLTASEIDFLDRTIAAAKARIARAEYNLGCRHT
jgi:multidrug resistance efflux pump